jgi:hypothetical protein
MNAQTRPRPWTHGVLPQAAQAMLKMAAASDQGQPVGESHERAKAVNYAMSKVRRAYSKYFRAVSGF